MSATVRVISIGICAGMLALIGLIWTLSQTLGNLHEELYQGQPLSHWQEQLNGGDVAASNAALAVVNAVVIPRLVDEMFHDTNDSQLRLDLIGTLNGLPGVEIAYVEADRRRAVAAYFLGELGPVAAATVPSLIEVLKGPDVMVHESAIEALGKIHSDPDDVIPLLIKCLDDRNFDDEAARALSYYGSLAKAAEPKIIRLLRVGDRDDQLTAQEALKKIDPEAAAKAGIK